MYMCVCTCTLVWYSSCSFKGMCFASPSDANFVLASKETWKTQKHVCLSALSRGSPSAQDNAERGQRGVMGARMRGLW